MANLPITIPTTAQLTEEYIARYEARLNQTVPSSERSFVRVSSVIQALSATSTYKAAATALLDIFALTASRSGLIRIGQDVNLSPESAVATVLRIEMTAETDAELPGTAEFVGDANGLRYAVNSIATEDSGTITVDVTAQQTGTVGNLQAGDTLSIVSPVSGIGTSATVVSVETTGADAEDTEDFRTRLLDTIRSQGGGGNAADYRRWAQEVAGVVRAFPYSGKPADSSETDEPPDRTVYVQAAESINPDGIPPSSLLDQVRDSITSDPDTGESRQPLGLTDETLYVEPITRTSIFVDIVGLDVDASIEADVKTDIESALTLYFEAVRPFVDGLDVVTERRDAITQATVTQVVQNVVGANAGTIELARFGDAVDTFLNIYRVDPGELTKLAGVSYTGGAA